MQQSRLERSKQRGSMRKCTEGPTLFIWQWECFFVFFLFKMMHVESGLQPSLNWIKVENPLIHYCHRPVWKKYFKKKKKKIKYGLQPREDKRGESRGV
ncbi:hypothetical protein VIGAN_04126000 [Vigna angularis var. angularis]|uniref:Uncharacterized protein n=1 Tax=Vigna angularis var. angularis TaxID=157739 RepID=A0A0S3RTT9_PHAAN|nr:hypothetical protein VIGAN_04126000 [Vigna angularis var. angularis]